jgi:integrase
MARLTYGNIEGDIIKLTRAKTEREKRHSPRPITIVITKLIGRIIDHWGIKPALPSQYIFPILQSGMTPESEYKAIQQMTKNINDAVGDIAKALELPQKVTTYTARHSFATVLKRSGASTEFISESLGHSNVLTTENYLSDFETDVKWKIRTY